MRSLPFTATATPPNLIQRVNAGEVTSAPPKTVPSGVVTVDQAVARSRRADAPRHVLDLLKQYPWLPWAVLVVAIVLAICCSSCLARSRAPWRAVAARRRRLSTCFACCGGGLTDEQASQAISQAGQTPASVANYPDQPQLRAQRAGIVLRPDARGRRTAQPAARFNTALRALVPVERGRQRRGAASRSGRARPRTRSPTRCVDGGRSRRPRSCAAASA